MSIHVAKALKHVEVGLESLGARARHELGVKLDQIVTQHKKQIVSVVSRTLAAEADRVLPLGVENVIEAQLGESVPDAVAEAVDKVTDAVGDAIRKAFHIGG